MAFSSVLPFASATDSTLHRQPWRSTQATDHAARRSPRKLPSRCRAMLQHELLHSPRTASMPSASSPRPPLSPQSPSRASVSSSAPSSAVAIEPDNVDELQWLQHRWLGRHGKTSEFKALRAQVALLRRWFESLDADGSGEVGLDELEDPLVSVGLARDRADVQQLIDRVDRDGSGEITFAEFLAMMYPSRRAAQPPRPALHAPKHRATPVDASPRSPASVSSPPTSPRGRHATSAIVDGGLAGPRRKPEEAQDEGPNPVVKLFRDLQSGRLGDLAIPFPVLITAYRRRMLLNAHMAEDPAARSLGAAVLRALEGSRRASTLSGFVTRRQSGPYDADGGLGAQLRLPTLQVAEDRLLTLEVQQPVVHLHAAARQHVQTKTRQQSIFEAERSVR